MMYANTQHKHALFLYFLGLLALGILGCQAAPAGLGPAQPSATTVKLDFEHRPLPEIPLPSDLAVRYDATAATGRRLNASMIAPTSFEKKTRSLIDGLDGWGVFMPITVPFSGLIAIQDVVNHQQHDNYAFGDDVIYLIDITRGSPGYGQPVAVDLGSGNYPHVLKDRNLFGQSANDARGDTLAALFEDVEEDLNHNGQLDAGEDTDLDGVLDHPNYLPDHTPTATDWPGRADALMTWYERETNTMILRPLRPLREQTTYAVVVTRRLHDANGQAVGSPYPTINHTAQTTELQPLADILASKPAALGGLTLADVAFCWSFTTGSMKGDLRAARDGLYGLGPQAQLATDFPSTINHLEPVHKGGTDGFHAYVISSEKFQVVFGQLASQLLGMDLNSEQGKRLLNAQKYIDYHVLGSFDSPRLFPRKDAQGNYLSYNDMVWPPDLSRMAATAYHEQVSFWLTVPRKEVSARKDNKPANLAIIGHGYMGSRLDAAMFGGSFAMHGLATLAIDNVSHGIPLGPKNIAQLHDYDGIIEALELPGLITALTATRAWDQDLDGDPDPGADFWTAYTFHTRDVLRQTALDYMQAVRIVRGFDNTALWATDVNEDGKANDLAGDFDGDGFIDIGGKDTAIGMTGSSLGGIMAAIMAGTEPQIAALVPMCSGGGLADVGIRSQQGGVREAVMLRVMGPLYAGEPEGDHLAINAVAPRLNQTEVLKIAEVPMPKPGDSVLAENLDNGEYDCAIVMPSGRFRVGLASDVNLFTQAPQRHRLQFFAGNAFVPGVRDPVKAKACQLKQGAKPTYVLDKFGVEVNYHYQSLPLTFHKGEPLAPIAEGLGLHRARPELRRFLTIAQLVLDPSDPAVIASWWQDGSMQFGNGEVVKPHAIVLSTIGDMAVPLATGAAIARSAGFIDWTTPRPEWGNRTANQVLIDAHVLEGVNVIGRFVAPDGSLVLADPEDFSQSAALSSGSDWLTSPPYPVGQDGYQVPRLRMPLHNHLLSDDGHGGISGAIFPLVIPEGKHDIDDPGQHTDRQMALCKAAGKSDTECSPQNHTYFDHGALLRHAIAAYMASAGKAFPLQPCQSTENCPDWPAAPAKRP